MNAKGAVYLVLALSVGFASAFKGNNLLFVVFCILAAHFVVSAIFTVLVARGLELSRLLPESAVAGELAPLGIRLQNRKRFLPAFCLKIEEQLRQAGRPVLPPPPAVWIPLVGARKRARTVCPVIVPERGWCRLGPFRVSSEFTPGLFTYRRVVPVSDRLLVYPRLGSIPRRYLDPLLARIEFSEHTPIDFRAGQEEFAGLREFREGDNPRHIHWKMSARIPDRLLVRDQDDPQVREAAVILETLIPKPHDSRRRRRLERAISFAATLCDSLLREGWRVRFRAFAPERVALDADPRGGGFDEILRALALLHSSRRGTLAELLAAEDAARPCARFLLRIGDEALPAREGPAPHIVLGAAEMRSLLDDAATEDEP